jgi:hypothetical protein
MTEVLLASLSTICAVTAWVQYAANKQLHERIDVLGRRIDTVSIVQDAHHGLLMRITDGEVGK